MRTEVADTDKLQAQLTSTWTAIGLPSKKCPSTLFDDPVFCEALSSPEKAQAWLDAHLNDGVGHLNEKDGYDCQICHNTGLLYRRDENGILISWECECKKERAKIFAEKHSGSPSDTKYKTFDTYNADTDWQQKFKQSAMSFTQNCIDGSLSWFFIGGQPGSGKTHLAKSIQNVLVGADKRIVYMDWRTEVSHLIALLNADGYRSELDKYRKAEVLLIDDFLKTRREANGTYSLPTDGEVKRAHEIIKYRDENNLVTVLTSEFTINGIHEFDQSVGGRIKQRCGAYCFNILPDSGKDYRL